MHELVVPSRSSPAGLTSGRALSRWLIAAFALLAPAILIVPPLLAAWGTNGDYLRASTLRASLASGLVHFWHSGDAALHPDLAAPVQYWARFHTIKAVLAALLLLVLILLARRLSALQPSAQGARRLVSGFLAVASRMAMVLAVLVIMANVQGAIAPLSSALSLLDVTEPDPTLAPTLTQMHDQLTRGETSPVLDVVARDFVVYHAVVAIMSAVMLTALLTSTILSWRRRAKPPPHEDRDRRAAVVSVLGGALFAALLSVVIAANLSTVIHPTPALLVYLAGG